MKDSIDKQILRDSLLNLKLEETKLFNRIKELECIVGMELDEYEELNKLYSEYYEVSITIKVLNKLLNISKKYILR